MAVELTEEEKVSPLRKYFDLDIKPTPQEVIDKVMKGDFDPAEALPITEMNRLFDDGYLPGEFGWWRLPDGGLEVANLTDMPGVEPEMFDWWFAWHGLETMRYKIWDQDDHYYCQTRNPDIAKDESLSMKERYWGTTHDVKEALLDGQPPVDVILNFVRPDEIGFDKDKLNNFKGTIVCTPGPAVMAHFVRPTKNGCELRTRFWVGYMAKEGKITRIPDFPADEMFAKALLIHNVKEFTHLAEILPDVYAEYKDKF